MLITFKLASLLLLLLMYTPTIQQLVNMPPLSYLPFLFAYERNDEARYMRSHIVRFVSLYVVQMITILHIEH